MAKNVIVLAIILVCQFCLKIVAAYTFADNYCTGTNMNYTSGSVYEKNLNRLFGNLTSKTTSQKFYNYTTGIGSNQVYGLYQCRNDIIFRVCSECVQNATRMIVEVCPLYGEAILWHYECVVRYANRYIFSMSETFPGTLVWSRINVSNANAFVPKLASAMNDVIQDASSTPLRFASAETNVTLLEQVFSFAQCTPDIDPSSCNNCLKRAYSDMIKFCNASITVLVFFPSCQLRYDTTGPFIFKPVPVAPPPPGIDQDSQTSSNKLSMTPGIIAAIAVSASIGFLGLSAVFWICLFRKKPKEASNSVHLASTRGRVDGSESIGDDEFMQYDLATMKLATGDFSAENALGEGGFGIVYKGTLENGQQLAIKRLSDSSGQGNKEFMAEARLLAKLQHKNLVRLMGVCSEGDEKLLAYEFLPNSSLDQFLFDPMKRPMLNWETRYKIILGIARGLQYLHEDSRLTIIHRDLKPSNILLDEKMNPKIADFGMAKLFGFEQSHGYTTHIMGTRGYMAPEFMTGEYSDKSDVYSFGIMLLEIVSGQKNRLFNTSPRIEDLPTLAWRLWDEGRSLDLTDPALHNNNSSTNDVIRCTQIGLLCVQENAEQRPAMASIVLMLTGSTDLPLPLAPSMSFHQFGIANSFSGNPQTGSDQLSVNTVTWQTESDQDLYPRPR